MSFFPTELLYRPKLHISYASPVQPAKIKVNRTLDVFPYHLFEHYRTTQAMRTTINVDKLMNEHESSLFDDTLNLERLANLNRMNIANYGKDFFKKFAVMGVKKEKRNSKERKRTFISMLVDLVHKKKSKKKLLYRTKEYEMNKTTTILNKRKEVKLPKLNMMSFINGKVKSKGSSKGTYYTIKTEPNYSKKRKIPN